VNTATESSSRGMATGPQAFQIAAPMGAPERGQRIVAASFGQAGAGLA
jgi:hypothetical protein